jgi:hypothetical protein
LDARASSTPKMEAESFSETSVSIHHTKGRGTSAESNVEQKLPQFVYVILRASRRYFWFRALVARTGCAEASGGQQDTWRATDVRINMVLYWVNSGGNSLRYVALIYSRKRTSLCQSQLTSYAVGYGVDNRGIVFRSSAPFNIFPSSPKRPDRFWEPSGIQFSVSW